MADIDEIKERIAKLLEHKESAEKLGNEDEAAAYAAEVQRRLEKYKLSAASIEMTSDEIEVEKEAFVPQHHNVEPYQHRCKWQERIAGSIARAYYCEILVMTGTNALTFIGEESDRKCAMYVHAKLVRTCKRLGRNAYNWARRNDENTSGFLSAFYRSFSRTIASRARELRRESRERAEEHGEDALIRLDQTKQKIDEITGAYNTASKIDGSRSLNRAGSQAGRKAGGSGDLRANGLDACTSKASLPE